jgi:hypothetical protein
MNLEPIPRRTGATLSRGIADARIPVRGRADACCVILGGLLHQSRATRIMER